jgi:hypothetical protein
LQRSLEDAVRLHFGIPDPVERAMNRMWYGDSGILHVENPNVNGDLSMSNSLNQNRLLRTSIFSRYSMFWSGWGEYLEQSMTTTPTSLSDMGIQGLSRIEHEEQDIALAESIKALSERGLFVNKNYSGW